jgi:ATP-binding cassette, subfamily B, bacterial
VSSGERRYVPEAEQPESGSGEPKAASKGEERRYTDRVIYRRVLRDARPYWGHIGVIFVLTLLSTPLALLAPVPLKIAVDSVLGDEPLPGFLQPLVPESVQGSTSGLLVFVVGLLFVVALASQLRSLSTNVLRTYTSECLTLRFRVMLFGHAQRLSMAYHDLRGSSDANYRIQRDAGSMATVAVEGVMPFISACATFLAMVVVIAAIDVVLAAIAILVAPLLGSLTWFYRRRLRHRHREVKSLESRALGVVQEVLGSIRVVRAFGQEEQEERRFLDLAGEGMRARLKVALVDGSFLVAIGVVSALGTAAVLFVGVKNVETGSLSLGSLLLVMGYLASLYGPLYTMSRQVASLQSGFASAERAFSLLDEARDVPEKPDAKPIDTARGHVVFDGVGFAYEPDRPVLDEVSFRVEEGMRVGIAGRTGSGKTTLMSLLTRFYDPTSGSITLDGVDLRDYRIADLRNQFAIVLQEPVLFSTTIGENIAYGRPDATAAQIHAAAKAADVHDFVSSLPEGYDTVVGERGMTLSGGERQRVSLARAFLKDAPILILDEPTSSVDLKTEATIIDAMERLMAGRTTFMIAHRLSTLEGCDVRLELRDGHVIVPTTPKAERALVASQASSDQPEQPPPTPRSPSRRVSHLRLLPAVHAWEQLTGAHSSFSAVDVLKESKGTQVFRLRGEAPVEDVVAKRRKRTKLEPERAVYERLLAALPVRPPRYFGHLDESEGEFGWLFTEYVEGEPVRVTDQRHLSALAEHVGGVHSGAASLEGLRDLPDRSLTFFYRQVESATAQLQLGIENETIGPCDRDVLEAHLDLLQGLHGAWDGLAHTMEHVPPTLVHCDLISSNTRIAGANGDARVVVFDWEYCGFGTPAPDVAMLSGNPPSLRRYVDALGGWGDLSFADVQALAEVGVVLRFVLAIGWEAASLGYPNPHRSLRRLTRYRDPFHAATDRVRLATSA